jgi:hypothetical protein
MSAAIPRLNPWFWPFEVLESMGLYLSSHSLKGELSMSQHNLDLVNSVVTMAAIAINLVAFTQALSRSLTRQLALAGIGGGWVGLAVILGASGRLAYAPNSPVPLVGILLATPLVAFGALMLTSEKVCTTLLAIPLQLLIGLNALRMLGVLFLLDFVAKSLKGPFPFFAGLGDIITGAIAIPLALRVADSKGTSLRSMRDGTPLERLTSL